jgi:serine/threonine protein kinase
MAKFYYTNDKAFKIVIPNETPARQILYDECVLMDYYTYKGMDNFTSINRITISPMTLLNMLVQVALSLRFMKNVHMTHLDLKPNNVVVGKGLLVKMLDLGEAYVYLDKETEKRT